jgi:hypothetical protein
VLPIKVGPWRESKTMHAITANHFREQQPRHLRLFGSDIVSTTRATAPASANAELVRQILRNSSVLISSFSRSLPVGPIEANTMARPALLPAKS